MRGHSPAPVLSALALVALAACGGGSGSGGPPGPPPPPPPPPAFNFTPASPATEDLTPEAPTRMVKTLFNADGFLDLVAISPSTGKVSVVLGDGAGGLAFLGSFTCGTGSVDPMGLAVADLNGDGFPDVVVTNFGTDTVSVLVNALGASLGAATTFPAPNEPFSVVAGNFDAGPTVDLMVGGSTALWFLAGNGAASFAAGVPVPTFVSPGAIDLATGDVDLDLDLDIVVRSVGLVEILKNNGAAVFTSAIVPSASLFGRLTLADVAGTPHLDIISTATSDGNFVVHVNDGTGVFGTFIPTAAPQGPIGVTTANIDGDAFTDVIVACSLDGNVRIYPGNGDGTFDAPQLESTGTTPNTPVHGAFAVTQGIAVSLTGDLAIFLMTKP